MRSIERVVRNPSGFHARPAATFVRAAAGFASRVTVENLDRGGAPLDAKSIIAVLSVGASRGHTVRISADGPDEDAATEALGALVDSGMGEALQDEA